MNETLFRRQVSILFALITRLFSIRIVTIELFVTIRDYSSLFATIRTVRTIRYSRLFAIRYSGFPDTPYYTDAIYDDGIIPTLCLPLNQASVVQTMDSAIHWINRYSLDNFASVYPLDSDLSGG